MTSLAYPPERARRIRPFALPAFLERNGSDVLLSVAMLALASALVAYLSSAFSVDSWLALVTGSEVWHSGLPHHETLTAVAQGTTWIDQQWLSQLATYALYLAGGLGLVGLANVVLLVGGVAGALTAARGLGASPKAVLLVLPVCLWLLLPSREVRTQEFVIPLFVALVYLLASDSRAPSPRVYWCLPILVVWANLHGSVTLAAGLVVLRAATLTWERRAQLPRSIVAWRRPLMLGLLAPVCMLITPYGVGILSYLHTMFLGSTVRSAVTEWQPITSAFIVAWPFFALAAGTVWCFGRWPARTTSWEKLALVALAAGSILVIRNLLFFSLCALIVVPLAFDTRAVKAAAAGGPRRARLNGALLSAAALTFVIASVATLVRPATKIEFSEQRAGVLAAVQSATKADPSLKVLADVRFADWLLWRDPALAGRVANDARFELLTATETRRLQRVFSAFGNDWKLGANGYRLLVLDRKYAPDTTAGFLAEPGHRVLYDDGERVVVLRGVT